MKNDATFAWLNVRLEKKRIGSIGSRARSSQMTNAATSTRADRQGDDDLRARPALAVAADEAPDDAEEAGADEREPAQVEARARAARLVQAPPRERHEREADGDVDPEDPLPRQPLDHGAADERAEGDGEAADAAPGAEREAAALGRDRRAEDRQRERRDDRAADALKRAGRDERLDRRRERSERGGRREDARGR